MGGFGQVKAMQQVYSVPQTPEFLFDMEAKIKRRTLGDNLVYYTGVGYLAGKAVVVDLDKVIILMIIMMG